MNKSSGKERRKFERRNLSYYLPIRDSITEQLIGHLVDVSPIGMMIDCKKNIPTNQNYNLRVEFMNNENGKDQIEFVARCRWCHADKIQPYLYNAGFEIVTIAEDDLLTIKNIANKYGERSRSF
jgi:hypothetical protein